MVTSSRIEVAGPSAAAELFQERGWTDGLPIVPPTEDRVCALLEAGRRAPDEVLGEVRERGRRITAEKVAVNAVMAGCLPAYAPVVFATIEAMCEPDFGLHGMSASTGGAAVLIVVHGPIAREIGINAGDNLFGPGPGSRANATIGRAIRLVLLNLCGAQPGGLDRSTFGHAGKYTYCIAEDEAHSPWPPLHTDRGFAAEDSAVTVFAAEAPHQLNNDLSQDPEGILTTIAMTACCPGTMNVTLGGEYLIILGGEHAELIARYGWDKERVRSFLFAECRLSVAELKRAGRLTGPPQPSDADVFRPLVPTPERLLLMQAGGRAGAWSVVIPGWAAYTSSRALTRRVRV